MCAHLSRERSVANLFSMLLFRPGSLIHMRPLKIWLNFGSIEALRPWRKDTSRVVVTMDALTRVRGAVFEGIPASWLGSESQSQWHSSTAARTLACTDTHRQHVCGLVNKSPSGVRSRALCKQAADLLLWVDCHFLSIRAAHIPGLAGLTCCRGRGLLKESGGCIWNLYGRAEVDLFATNKKAHCPLFFSLSHSPLEGDALTSCWPAAGCMCFLRSRYCHWCYTRSGRSELQWYSSPRTCLGSQTWQNCWWHRPGRSPSRRICYPRWMARCGTRTRSCGAFMCGCFGDIREAERTAFSCARYALGGASTLYETFVCLKMGSVCEMVRSGSYRPGYLHRVGCSEFSTVQAG